MLPLLEIHQAVRSSYYAYQSLILVEQAWCTRRYSREHRLPMVEVRASVDNVFDYNSPSLTNDVSAGVYQGTCVGIYFATDHVASACRGSHKSKPQLFVASSHPLVPGETREGVEINMSIGARGAQIFEETMVLLSEALCNGIGRRIAQCRSDPEAVPTKGLECIKEAVDVLKKGVSARNWLSRLRRIHA